MNEKEFTVLLTKQQEVKMLACEPQKDLFATARDLLGCEWIELVEPDDPALRGYLMLIDEEGKLWNGTVWVNCVASDLSGSDWHGDFIVGNAMIVRAEGGHLTLLTKDEAEMLAEKLEGMREMSIEKISAALGLSPARKRENEIASMTRRQRCRNSGMERS